jgi:hypothetical protein
MATYKDLKNKTIKNFLQMMHYDVLTVKKLDFCKCQEIKQGFWPNDILSLSILLCSAPVIDKVKILV